MKESLFCGPTSQEGPKEKVIERKKALEKTVNTPHTAKTQSQKTRSCVTTGF